MTTRAKLYTAVYAYCIMTFLNVFSKPLHIPDALQWVLIIGSFIPLGFVIYFLRKKKLEARAQTANVDISAPLGTKSKQAAKQQLILMMVLGSAVGLSSPLWMPLTGTSLGPRGDFVCGLITAAVICTLLGFRLRKL